MHSPDSAPPAFAEHASDPLPESPVVQRPAPIESLHNVPPEITPTSQRQYIQSPSNSPPEINTIQSESKHSMSTHYNTAIHLASAPDAPQASNSNAIAPPAYSPSPSFSSQARQTSSSSLTKPIVIPCTTGKLGSPFLRCYAPELEQYHLPREVFLKHLDALNNAVVAAPPLQVLGMADEIPIPIIGLVGGIIGGISKLGSSGISYGRTEMMLKELNRDVFGPRGLKVDICSLKAVARVAGVPILGADGRLRGGEGLLGEIEQEDIERISGFDRRMRVVSGCIAELEIVNEVEEKKGLFQGMGKKLSSHDTKKHEKYLMEHRRQWYEQHRQEVVEMQKQHDIKMEAVDAKEERIVKSERMDGARKEEEMERLEVRRRELRLLLDARLGDVKRRRVEGDVEEQEMRGSRWLVITAAETGKSMGSARESGVDVKV